MEENKKKIDKKLIIIIVLVILLILLAIYILFMKKDSYTITFDSNGGSKITSIKVKDNEVVKLPDAPKKDGHKFVGWTNDDGKVITKGTKVDDDLNLKAQWIMEDADAIEVSYDTDGGNEIDKIIIEKGKIILLPTNPIKNGYIFVGWFDENGNFVSDNMVLNENITLKAYWISKDAKTYTVKFDSDGGSNLGSIIVEEGKVIYLPINPTKEGYVFAGWVDDDGNPVSKDTIVNKNTTIKATWKEPYTCPSDCTPTGDGSKCIKETTKNMIDITSCPSGYSLKNGKCIDKSTRYYADNGDSGWKCNSSKDYMYTEIDESGLGALMWCVKTTDKVTKKGCPSGYKQSDNVCKKTETIKCKAN